MECINPVFVRRSGIHVRCGKCLPCLEFRVREWAVRIRSDFEKSGTAYFVTLTYDDEHLKSPELDKCDFQRFLKRLRQYHLRGMPDYYSGKKVSQIALKVPNFKYFAVGEYGTKTERKHWHFILLNFPYNIEDTEMMISEAWKENGIPKGFDRIGVLSEGGIMYTLDYMFKNQDKSCVRLMSKNLGSEYITENRFNYHRRSVGGFTVLSGQKLPLPRYLKNKLYNEKERKLIGEKSRDFILEENLSKPELRQNKLRQLKNKVEFKNQKRK